MKATILIRIPHPDHPSHAIAQATTTVDVEANPDHVALLTEALSKAPPVGEWPGIRSVGGGL